MEDEISVKNESDQMLLIWVEPFAFSEELPPGSKFRLKVESLNARTTSFELTYSSSQISIFCDFNMEYKGNYTFIYEVDAKETSRNNW